MAGTEQIAEMKQAGDVEETTRMDEIATLEKKASDRGDNRNKMGKHGRAEWTRGTKMEAISKKWNRGRSPCEWASQTVGWHC